MTIAMIAGTTLGFTQDSQPQLPILEKAELPVYPATAWYAGIRGTVHLKVSTDGKNVSKVEIESGQPMLAKAAEANVRTWLFRDHTPTSFETTFNYKLLPGTDCNVYNNNIALQLPTDVEITAKQVWICDPVAEEPKR